MGTHGVPTKLLIRLRRIQPSERARLLRRTLDGLADRTGCDNSDIYNEYVDCGVADRCDDVVEGQGGQR